MKKLFVNLLILLAISPSFAQKSLDANSPVFGYESNVINAGLGLGDVYFASVSNSGIPVSFHASYERGVTQKLGIGYIGLGGDFSFASAKEVIGNTTYTNSGILFAARAAYHFAITGEVGRKLDPYAGILAGFVIASHSSKGPGSDINTYEHSGGPAAGAFVGAHYYFVPNFGVFAELGYNITSVFNTGLSFKF